MKRKRSFFYISMTCSVLCFFSRSHAINSLGINCRVSLLGNIAVRTSADSSGLINYQMKDYNFFRPAGRWPELKNAVMTIKIIPDGDLDATRIHPSKQIPGLWILTLAEISIQLRRSDRHCTGKLLLSPLLKICKELIFGRFLRRWY
jgi:hypothetical protein